MDAARDEELGRLLSTLPHGGVDFDSLVSGAVRDDLLSEDTSAALLALRADFEQRARKENLLRVLHDISNDLVALREVDVILRTIVRRARSLVSADMSYISLNDDSAGDTYIRTTDGVATQAFAAIRMPVGVGILGTVATGRSAAQTSDFFADRSFAHLPDVDAAVAGEGVRSILGVPLLAGSEVIGALLVAHRTPHHYSLDDISLLTQLGAIAAVVLQNGRLFEEQERTLHQLQIAERERTAQMQSLERLSALDELLIGALPSDSPAQGVAAVLTESLGAPACVVDAAGLPLTDHEFELPASEIVRRAISKAQQNRVPVRVHQSDNVWNIAGIDGGSGAVVVVGDLTAEALTTLRRASLAVSVALLIDKSTELSMHMRQAELVGDLLSGSSSPAARRRRLADAGFGAHDSYAVGEVHVADDHRDRAAGILRRYLQGGKGLIAGRHGGFSFVTTATALRSVPVLSELLEDEGIPAVVGLSGDITDMLEIPVGGAEARGALAALMALGRASATARLAELGTVGMILSAARAGSATQMIDGSIGDLLTYDAARGTRLVETAGTFLDVDDGLAAAAEKLHIHLNTLRQRLSRIEAILGEGWDRGRRRLDVQVAIEAHRLRRGGITDSPFDDA